MWLYDHLSTTWSASWSLRFLLSRSLERSLFGRCINNRFNENDFFNGYAMDYFRLWRIDGLPYFVVNLHPNGELLPLHGQWDVCIHSQWSVFHISGKSNTTFTSVVDGSITLYTFRQRRTCVFYMASGSVAPLNVVIWSFIKVISKLIAKFFTRQITRKIINW